MHRASNVSLPAGSTAAPQSTAPQVSTDPCRAVSDDNVGGPFGGAAVMVGNTVENEPQECTWRVSGAMAGTVEVTVLYPNAAEADAQASDAVELVMYRHDFTLQNFPNKSADLEEVTGVGVYAYLDTWTRSIHVAISSELAVSVQWVSATTGDFGTPIRDDVRAALAATALAVAPDLLGA